MTYTIQTVRTAAGTRYYVRRADGKLIRAGFGTRTAAQERIERIKFFELLNEAQEQIRQQLREMQVK